MQHQNSNHIVTKNNLDHPKICDSQLLRDSEYKGMAFWDEVIQWAEFMTPISCGHST